MRIVLIGQAAFAQQVLDGLLERGHDVAAVYCPPDAAGGRPDPLKSRALEVGIPVRQHRSLKGDAVRREFAELGADLGVLAYVTQIVPPAVFDAPRLGSICFHPSLLPRYRGGSAIPWQVIKGEKRTGVTVFWTDDGIDTGPILLQKEAELGADDTAGTLYFKKLFPIGVEAVLESVDRIAAGTAPRVAQDESLATYDPLCRDEHAEIDWSRPIAEVYNLIRGCDPQPGAYSRRGDVMVRLYDARPEGAVSHAAGVVAAIDGDGIVIAGNGGSLRVARMRAAGGKVAAAEAAAELGLRVGEPLASKE
jgi:methionyl-tRNA formyltransferase